MELHEKKPFKFIGFEFEALQKNSILFSLLAVSKQGR